jgi:hypothetical protein
MVDGNESTFEAFSVTESEDGAQCECNNLYTTYSRPLNTNGIAITIFFRTIQHYYLS